MEEGQEENGIQTSQAVGALQMVGVVQEEEEDWWQPNSRDIAYRPSSVLPSPDVSSLFDLKDNSAPNMLIIIPIFIGVMKCNFDWLIDVKHWK